MTLLEQFLAETRDALHSIGAMLMALESCPDDAELMTGLFRVVHTLKGNSGLFDYPEMTRVLHAAEDVMDAVRQGRLGYSTELADRLLDTMDFVGALCDAIGGECQMDASCGADATQLAIGLRQLLTDQPALVPGAPALPASCHGAAPAPAALSAIPQTVRMAAYELAKQSGSERDLHWLSYVPDRQCFFQGDDPFFQARGTPELLWGGISASEPWAGLVEMDAYCCVLRFHVLSSAPRAVLDQHYRYIADQVDIVSLPPLQLVLPQGQASAGAAARDFVLDALDLLHEGELDALANSARAARASASDTSWLASALDWLLLLLRCPPVQQTALVALIETLHDDMAPAWSALAEVETVPSLPAAAAMEPLAALIDAQRRVLQQSIPADGQTGRSNAVSAALAGILRASDAVALLPGLACATESALQCGAALPLLAWMDQHLSAGIVPTDATHTEARVDAPARADRRQEDAGTSKSIKVDQVKIDHLMSLIGEMVVAKNALPYLAERADSVFGARDMSRDIKNNYLIINRIVEEMQGAIMQVRMMPVSFVFQRFPRLVRDLSRKLGKQVELVLEGEDTEADKNIIEALADPLVHIVRNSLDHGFELPAVRAAAGKPASGRLTIRAAQEADRVVIEIRDDGKGIDPEVVGRKALERGLVDSAALERMSEQEVINLVFAAGFSTADTVSDLSGRGVGMDVVRAAVARANGTMQLESRKHIGTCIRLSLPLSMAVSSVIIVESDGQTFGVPMEQVVETVRVPQDRVCGLKQARTTVLRNRIVPLKSINNLLGLTAAPKTNEQDELAVLVMRVGGEAVGLLVDEFHQTMDIILKPMTGLLAGLSAYAGSALMGDGSVLMVLDVKELI